MKEKKNYNLITPTKILDDKFIILSEPYSYPGHFFEGKMIPCMAIVDERCYACETHVQKHNRHSFGIFNITKKHYSIMCCSDAYIRKLKKVFHGISFYKDKPKSHHIIIYNCGLDPKSNDKKVKHYNLTIDVCKTNEQKEWCDNKLKNFDIDELIYLVSNGPSEKIKKRMRAQIKTMLFL